MPTYFRRDDDVQNGLGYAIPNVAVTYYTQPSQELAAVFSNSTGTPAANPQFTDGLGHADAYMLAGQYTITYSGEQIQTIAFPDQTVGGDVAGSTVTVFQGTPAGTIDGVNRVFMLTDGGTPLTAAPAQVDVWLNFPLVAGVGYTLTGVIVTYAVAPQPGDTVWDQGLIIT